MDITIGFRLDDDGTKSFLERIVFERVGDTIHVGVQKPNGDWYAWATLTEEQLAKAMRLLEVPSTPP